MVANEFDTETVYDNVGGQYDITYDFDINGLHIVSIQYNGKSVLKDSHLWEKGLAILSAQYADTDTNYFGEWM